MAAALLAFALLSVTRFTVLPSDTDPDIRYYNVPHTVFVDPAASPRGELLVFLPGTNGKTGNATAFCSTAAELGYQAINLMYPDDVSASSVRDDPDPDAFLKFRLAVIEGRSLSRDVQVDRPESIENRLVMLLGYLDKKQPDGHWGRYITSEGLPNWPKIAVSGLSQGAGHAALIACRHRVARAVLFGGPKDYSRALNRPAAWYASPATPAEKIFAFNHEQDRQGCTFQEQLENCRAMGLDRLGQPVSVDTLAPPFNNSHILATNYPGTRLVSAQAHTSVVGDGSSPFAQDGSRLFKPVWVYMLTAGGD